MIEPKYSIEHKADILPRQSINQIRVNDYFDRGISGLFSKSNNLQSILFDKIDWSIEETKAWLSKNHFKPLKLTKALRG